MIKNLHDTNATEISNALIRAHSEQGPATGMVHTLLVVCREDIRERALGAALDAAREHPSRVILVVEANGGHDAPQGLCAEIRVGEGLPGDVVSLDVPASLEDHLDTILLPLLLPDSPVVAWWPGDSPEKPADTLIGKLATRRITDAGGVADPLAALAVRAEHHAPGDTDLTWTRLTSWRALLATALDLYDGQVQGGIVEAAPHNAPAELMRAWLSSCLGIDVDRLDTAGPGITGVRLHTPDGDISLLRPSGGQIASYTVPGQPTRSVALHRRNMTSLITEELRHSQPDEVFESATREYLTRLKADQARGTHPRVQSPSEGAS
ncbi:glucose-6-phosphate dehydrogenase assembly protein OpcA [Propionibacteriaceae bacterium Y1923]|uniref:glucose-6-phosphate dehydrogenase assembly protein OpcA n=1 Tax=Aestuariimicrobium sp. Y1814 TaxID=3418742 RepID=UPI003C27702E